MQWFSVLGSSGRLFQWWRLDLEPMLSRVDGGLWCLVTGDNGRKKLKTEFSEAFEQEMGFH
ncbi:hypothetical protein HanHA300_Chr13g0476291 [Helianthus annuus]|nr:hypothetical protein HanHA300_Chr13g0476291 [Helianthus annuus]KAJ0497153.1 hypothetical protein HanHA89_Chr13g0508281 [Helianthus annuus]KAJ0663171.1 hypothetical protein HanLR1_Chr13g0478321 [Helianthus annuus]